MENKNYRAHFLALLTIIIWGTTFISTKVLLVDFEPVEILLYRFLMGYAALWMISPRRMQVQNWRQELTFVGAGLCGICLYYLLENIALTYTLASNVGVIISIAPFFTAILAHLVFRGEERFGIPFFLGFVVAIVGIVLISFQGSKMQLNPMGDILALLAALVWGIYSILTRKIGSFEYPVILATRRTFFWGILFMISASFLFDFHWDVSRFMDAKNMCNLAYLGLGASALCFVTWNYSVKKLGAVKTSVYIYMVPVITVIMSALILKEKLTVISVLGVVFTIMGLLISEMRVGRKKEV